MELSNKMNFDPKFATEKLEKNRKEYIERLMCYVNMALRANNYDMVANYIVAAGDNLKALNGALDYLSAIGETEDGYPEFGTIFE